MSANNRTMNKRDAVVGELVLGTSSHTARPLKALQKCEEKSTKPGQWYCSACRTSFRNNFEAMAHFDSAEAGFTDEAGNFHDFDEHVAVWMCSEHGPEVP